MHRLETINAAVTAAVKAALDAAEMPAPMLSREVYESIPRPSAKVIFGETRMIRYNATAWERQIDIIIVWNAPDIYTYKLPCLAAQQIIEDYILATGIRLPDGNVLTTDNTRATISDACVLIAFSLSEYGPIDGAEDDEGGTSGEPMETLDEEME